MPGMKAAFRNLVKDSKVRVHAVFYKFRFKSRLWGTLKVTHIKLNMTQCGSVVQETKGMYCAAAVTEPQELLRVY